MKKFFTGFLMLVWMTVIFLFSAQTASDSAQTSQSVGYRIASWQNDLFHQEKTEAELIAQAETMQLIIRKGAHMGEYALLATLAAIHFGCYSFNKKQILLLAFLLTACYATSDEIHQIFVPGRAGRFSDVCIDSVGGAIGILVAGFLHLKGTGN